METQTSSPTENKKLEIPESTSQPIKKNFSEADVRREFPYGKLELVRLDDKVVGRATLQPGWKWSTSLKDILQTDLCLSAHFQYQLSGTLRIKMTDGTEIECKAGDVSMIPPGHDAWVVGDEPVVLVDFQGMAEYAVKPDEQHKH